MNREKGPSFMLLGLPYETAVALGYLVLALLWIFFSDRALVVLVPDPEQYVVFAIYKGWTYVVVTAALLYAVLHRIFRHIRMAQQKLFESEARYRLLVENQTDLVIKVDRAGCFLFASPSCCSLFGKTEDELLEGTFMQLIHEEDRAETVAALESILRPPYTAHIEHRALTREGLRWLSWKATGIVDQNGSVEASVVVGRDMTERKQTNDALRQSEARLAEAQHIAHIGRWDLDLVTNQLEWSDEIYALLEISRKDYSPAYDTMLSFIHPDDRDLLDNAFQKARTKKTTYQLEHRLLMPDGRIKWVYELGRFEFDDLGKPFRAFGTTQDITERKQMEEVRERLVAAIEQLSESVVITNLDGEIEYVNAAFERSTGYTRQEALGQNPRILKSGRQPPSFYRKLWKTIAAGTSWEGRFINKRKDGSFYTEEVMISPVKNAAGQIVNYVAIKMDVTRELEREEQLRQIQKMDSIGRLAGGIAHDFNNILQTITGFCGIILLEMDARSPQRADVAEIQKAATLAGELTKQLLAFSRKQPTAYALVDLNTVLSDGEKMLMQSLDEQTLLHFELETGLQHVHADASQFLQIVLNLLVNARDAMPNGGTITLATSNVAITEADLANMPEARPGRFVCLAVSDAGCGIEKDRLAHVFEPFYTTKPPGKGTGLGLSVVYGIVRDHRGWISVSSEPGRGSTFRVYLPVHDETAHAADYLDEDEPASRNRILLVVDDPVVRQLTGEILQDVGYAVSSVENAAEADEIFALKDGAFDLLFCDVDLPDRGGIELAQGCLKHHPGLTVLLFSKDPAEHPGVQALAAQGFLHLKKPFNFKKLLDTVERAINRR